MLQAFLAGAFASTAAAADGALFAPDFRKKPESQWAEVEKALHAFEADLAGFLEEYKEAVAHDSELVFATASSNHGLSPCQRRPDFQCVSAASFMDGFQSLVRSGGVTVSYTRSVRIAKSDVPTQTIYLGRQAWKNCTSTVETDLAECAGTIAHELVHLTTMSGFGSFDTPRKDYQDVLERVPTYLAEVVACERSRRTRELAPRQCHDFKAVAPSGIVGRWRDLP